MVKHHTRKARQTRKAHVPAKKSKVMGLKKLRQAFDSMDEFVNKLKPKVKHSFQNAVSDYREEWRRVFKRDISPADAAAYLKFKFGLKGLKALTRRGKMRGGSSHLPLSGAPLSSSGMGPGLNGVYGNFPTYQTQGLDRYYQSALTEDCGKPNGFPTDGSGAQTGGAAPVNWDLGTLFRSPLMPTHTPSYAGAYQSYMTNVKGVYPPYPSADPVQPSPRMYAATNYISKADTAPYNRQVPTDIYKP